MSDIAFPWVEAAILLPLLGAIWVRRLRDPREARRHSLIVCGLTLRVRLRRLAGNLAGRRRASRTPRLGSAVRDRRDERALAGAGGIALPADGAQHAEHDRTAQLVLVHTGRRGHPAGHVQQHPALGADRLAGGRNPRAAGRADLASQAAAGLSVSHGAVRRPAGGRSVHGRAGRLRARSR